jgi:cytochrome c1
MKRVFARARFRVMMLAVAIGLAHSSAGAHPAMADPVEYPFVPGFDRFYAPEDDDAHLADGGMLLIEELNCWSCHGVPDAWAARLRARAKLSLVGVGNRLSADDLWLFIRSPQHRKKGTTMPGQFSGPDRDDKALEAIVQYLSSLKTEVKKYPEGDVENGRKLYHTIGCGACHVPAKVEDYRPPEAPANVTIEQPSLPSVPVLFADRYDRNALIDFLLDPLKTRPDGRMPSAKLTVQEAADIAAYLQINREPLQANERAVLKVAPPTPEEGHKAFLSMKCFVCHDTGDAGAKTIGDSTGLLPGGPFQWLKAQTDRGCLSMEKKAGIPDYGLSDFQKRAIKLALVRMQSKQAPPTLSVHDKVDTEFTRMNCYACHEWQNKGGLEEARGQYFTVLDPTAHSLGELGRLPPKLDMVGRKLTRAWFEKLLWGEGGGVRPYMTARMPRFGEANAAPLISLLQAASVRDKPIKIDISGLLKHQRGEAGRILMGVGPGGLGCVSCHGLKDRKGLGVAVINLTHTTQRLQSEYFKELLLNPQATQQGTLMPPLFLGRKKADQEIEMLWTYLKEIDQSRLPEGLLQTGDYELKPEKEKRPIVFRTFLVGAGMQAVAVGFPQRMHAAFDALEVRWALTWKGRFLDAQSTWEERAMTPAKPLGDKVETLPLRMSLARLGSASDAWPEACGVSAGYTFKGYRIAKDGVPTFLYWLENIAVEDTLRPSADGKMWKRTVVARLAGIAGTNPPPNWYFLGLGKDAKPVPLQWKDGVATMEEEVQP